MALLGCEYHMIARDIPVMKLDEVYDFVSAVTTGFKNKKTMDDLFLICRADLFGRALPLSDAEFVNFEVAQKSCYTLFDKMQDIKVTDIPNFLKNNTNKNIQARLKEYALAYLQNEI